jgi:hypothetical protein
MAERVTCVLCDRDTDRGPRTVLCKRQDERATFSREVQARVRSRTQIPLTMVAIPAGAGVEVSSNRGLRDHALDAHARVTTHLLTPGRAFLSRLIPRLSREAFSSPTPRP